ncbi:MAG: hypothetical protein KY438_10140, partial [Actinobacteria bacterium]|nr:hypothetical protein [Actinomycetota bacterium]
MSRPLWTVVMVGLVLSPLAAFPAAAHEVGPAAAPVPGAQAGPSPCLLDTYRPDANDPLYRGTDPSRQLEAYVPFRIISYPCPRPVEERVIYLRAGSIELIAGGALVRQIPFSGAGSGAAVPFE